MKSSDSYNSNNGFGLLLQGPPGTGKSALALEFPKPWILDCDQNLTGAARRFKQLYPERKFWYDMVNVDDAGKEVPHDMRWDRFQTLVKLALATPDVGTVVIDGLTMVNDYLIDHILKIKTGAEKGKMTIADWGPFKTFLHRLIPMCRAYGKYFILTAHELYDKDEVTGITMMKVNLSGSVKDEIAGMFSDVWRMETVDVMEGTPSKMVHKFQLSIAKTSRLILKNSLGLPDAIIDPSWAKLEPYFKKGV